ncbi:hypothetical protein V6N11_047306 [Hibiscus sabdariffa]|uniref:Uncharacterized protein n=1 Tax=Hibiscus sabdariffa TaxID=183260 RepID=A0ABR2PBL0_9ROSI
MLMIMLKKLTRLQLLRWSNKGKEEDEDDQITEIIEDAITYSDESLLEVLHKQPVVTTEEEEFEANTPTPTSEQHDDATTVITPAIVTAEEEAAATKKRKLKIKKKPQQRESAIQPESKEERSWEQCYREMLEQSWHQIMTHQAVMEIFYKDNCP